ncbi:YbaY family lipoprotein [Rubrivirga sp. IMCC45206]|uniref:YbaY family lipoprotein n=1 Tax=Rubrivirga sp. IMCC45206 TaxID=3391614 RepID=UPI0039903861
MRLLLTLLLVAVGCSSVQPTAPDAALTGTVTYRERIALAPDAVVTVRLLDVSLADAPSVTLAEQTIRAEGRNVPIPYALRYDPARIAARHRYVVRAEIRDGAGDLRWTTDTAIPVLTNGAPTDGVEIRVVQVAGGTSAIAPADAAPDGLVGPEWRLVGIAAPDGVAAQPEAEEVPTITFRPDGQVGGQTGCNSFAGEYTLDADGGLRLMQIAATLRACLPPSSERAFLEVLDGVDRAAVSGGRLALRGPAGTLLFARADLGMAPQPTGQTLVYGCADGAFTVRVRTGPGELAVWLPERFASRYLVLGQVRAASGAKYQDGAVTVWTEGDEATLEVDGETFPDCRRQR